MNMTMTGMMTMTRTPEHEGHDQDAHDPHAWLSPKNAGTWLNLIAAQFVRG